MVSYSDFWLAAFDGRASDLDLLIVLVSGYRDVIKSEGSLVIRSAAIALYVL